MAFQVSAVSAELCRIAGWLKGARAVGPRAWKTLGSELGLGSRTFPSVGSDPEGVDAREEFEA